MSANQAREPRPSNYARRDVAEAPPKENLFSRRGFIKSAMGLAVAGALIPGAVTQVLPAMAPSALAAGGAGPVVLRDPATNAKIPVSISDLAGKAPVVVIAEWNFLPAVVYKVKKAVLEASTAARGYNTAQHALPHPTEPEHAILVYEGKCKHLGCTVGWNEGLPSSSDVGDYDDDGANDGSVLCPCHQGQYDIYDLALNKPGTPPPAPLNVIQFTIEAAEGDLGVSVSDAIVGTGKLEQGAYRDADLAGDGSAFAFSEGAAA